MPLDIFTLPTPDYIWHEDPLDETSCEMFKVSETGLVDTNDEIYVGGSCEFCTRLYTKESVLTLLESVAKLAEEMPTITGYPNGKSVQEHIGSLIRNIK